MTHFSFVQFSLLAYWGISMDDFNKMRRIIKAMRMQRATLHHYIRNENYEELNNYLTEVLESDISDEERSMILETLYPVREFIPLNILFTTIYNKMVENKATQEQINLFLEEYKELNVEKENSND